MKVVDAKTRQPNELIALSYWDNTSEVLALPGQLNDPWERMRKLYIHNSAVGPFYIAEHGKAFHPVFQGRDLGAYVTAQHAAKDLARGKTFRTPGVRDT